MRSMAKALVVSTDHDDTMRVMARYAAALVDEAGVVVAAHLHARPAAEARARLANGSDDSIFVFLHGRKRPLGIVDHHGSAVVDRRTIELLARRLVCGTCYSLDGLADRAVAEHAATIIGYTGELFVVVGDDYAAYAAAMMEAVLAPHRKLLSGASAGTAAAAARAAYIRLAEAWYKDGTAAGVTLSMVMRMNARRVGVRGEAGRTM
jgi:hypothetical protein